MLDDLAAVCDKTGFVPKHARVCLTVAERMNCIILFREPGKAARWLIEDNYAMKGFRIDTKSCDWGPMWGFVCADPRLSKVKDKSTGASYTESNVSWTEEALAGHIKHEWFGHPEGGGVAAWRAGYMPIVVSQVRINELRSRGIIQYSRDADDGSFFGVSSQVFRDATGPVILPWRLVPLRGAAEPWQRNDTPERWTGSYYVLCVDPRSAYRFEQRYVTGVARMTYAGMETILGLCNPGTTNRGFKACVTADYDLFASWPSKADQMGNQHALMGQIAKLRPAGAEIDSGVSRAANLTPSAALAVAESARVAHRPLAGGVARLPAIDDRLRAAGRMEHYRFGDVSARVMAIKTMLNTAIQGQGGYKGGNAIMHNEEAGNLKLAKPNLDQCLPLVGFVPSLPGASKSAAATPARIVCIQNLDDFKELADQVKARFTVIAKQEWLDRAGVVL